MGKTIKKKNLLGNIGMRLAQSRARNDPEFLSDITRAFLRKYFKRISSDDLLEYYSSKKDLTELITPNMDKLMKYAKKINLNTKEIASLINQYMPEFEISWILEWWKMDHKHLYAAVMNQPSSKQDDMKDWIVQQVELITKELTSKL